MGRGSALSSTKVTVPIGVIFNGGGHSGECNIKTKAKN
jgi:hypothetical protein